MSIVDCDLAFLTSTDSEDQDVQRLMSFPLLFTIKWTLTSAFSLFVFSLSRFNEHRLRTSRRYVFRPVCPTSCGALVRDVA